MKKFHTPGNIQFGKNIQIKRKKHEKTTATGDFNTSVSETDR